MGGFAFYPAPGRGNDDARSRHSSSLPSSGTTPAVSTRTSSISSFDGASASDDGQNHHPPGHTLEMPPSSRRHRSGRHDSRPAAARLFQKLRTVLPVLTTLTPRRGRIQVAAAASSSSSGAAADSHLAPPHLMPFSGAVRPFRRITGTLYGRRKGRVALVLQETPRCLPGLVVELALQTHALLRELGNPAGARIVLETQRRAASSDPAAASEEGKASGGRRRRSHGPPLLHELAWTMFCNGRKTGHAVRREATGDDLMVLETLRAVSMGAGVLPGRSSSATSGDSTQGTTDEEVPYMRGSFDHFVGSRDSESLHMIAPQGGGTGPELAVFFVRF